MIVKESISFQRGMDPKKALGIGRWDMLKSAEGAAKVFEWDFAEYDLHDVAFYEYTGSLVEISFMIPADIYNDKFGESFEEMDRIVNSWFRENMNLFCELSFMQKNPRIINDKKYLVVLGEIEQEK